MLVTTNPEPQVTVGTFPLTSVLWGQSKPGKPLIPVNCPQHRAALNIGEEARLAMQVETSPTGQALNQAPAWHKTSAVLATTEKYECWKTEIIFVGNHTPNKCRNYDSKSQ